MSVFLLLLLFICLIGLKFGFKDGFPDYMSPQKSNSIKGIFIVLVVLSHTRQFVTIKPTALNNPFLEIISFLGQLLVVMFFFYSGYGISLGLQKKEKYAVSIFTKRFPKVLIHFDIAVIIYYLVSILLGTKYSVKTLLLSLIGLETVGNIVWYIFITLVLYLLTFLVFVIFRKKTLAGTIVFTILSAALAFAVFLWKGKEQYWWYDTIMCFPLGMWYSIAKPKIDKLLLNDFNKWISCTISAVISFAFLYYLMNHFGKQMYLFIPASLLFGISIVLLSMRISINNKILSWLGNNIFGIYILHYMPMKILTYFNLNQNAVLFTLISFAATIPLAFIFEWLMHKLDIVLRLSKKQNK